MGALHTAYPDDVEAQAFYGLALATSIGPEDAVGDARKALAALAPGFEAHPDHPGFAHYIIHTCDSPQMAREGLPAAEAYAGIAPSSAHALHMPGHIFARLGMWREDINSNKASAKSVLGNIEPTAAHLHSLPDTANDGIAAFISYVEVEFPCHLQP
jgi:hypothetical protein